MWSCAMLTSTDIQNLLTYFFYSSLDLLFLSLKIDLSLLGANCGELP